MKTRYGWGPTSTGHDLLNIAGKIFIEQHSICFAGHTISYRFVTALLPMLTIS